VLSLPDSLIIDRFGRTKDNLMFLLENPQPQIESGTIIRLDNGDTYLVKEVIQGRKNRVGLQVSQS